MNKRLAKIMKKARQSHAYKREKIVLSLTEEMIVLMEQQEINKSELAERLGKSKPYITKIMSGSANFTLDSLIQIADALDSEINVHLTHKNCETLWIDVHNESASKTLRKNSDPGWNNWQSDEAYETYELTQLHQKV